MTTERLLFIGDVERAEFRRLATALSRVYRMSVARNLRMALRAMRGNERWSPILLAPSCPGEFDRVEWDALRDRQPDADFSMVVGSWSEGETRSGFPWPDLPRAYVDQWLARCVGGGTASLPDVKSGQTSGLEAAIARTATPLSSHEGGLLTLSADDWAAQDYLAEIARSAGWQVRLHRDDVRPPVDQPITTRQVVIYDATANSAVRTQHVRELVRAYPQIGLIVLVGFPREWEVSELTSLGAAAVLGKPFLVDDLYRYLQASADIISAVRAA